MKPNVIIPNAVLVPAELRKIGNLTPVIYPISQEIVFDFLYKQYRETCEKITVVCYEQSGAVHEKLSRGYENTEVIDLEQLKDLAYTVRFGIKDDGKPIIINFADTIVSDNIYDFPLDSYFYSEDDPSEKWTFFEEENGVIKTIYDKTKVRNGAHKLFVGVFSFSDSGLLKKCIEEAEGQKSDEGVSAFYRAVKLYSEAKPIKAVKTDNWFDIGHIERYYNSSLEVKARSFNHISIDKNRGILRKSSDDKEKFIGEIKWYLKLPNDIEYVRPRIFSYSLSYEKPYVEMEYYSYHTLHELFLYGDLTYEQWRDAFRRIRFICNDFKRYKLRDENIKDALADIYLDKTVLRLEKLRDSENFGMFFRRPMTINGKHYRSLDECIQILKKIIPEQLYDVEEFNIIHGDLCFANIMIDSNFSFIKVIDPRGKFGQYDIYGDFRYELAKLFHSVHGKYDFIIKDLFSIEYDAKDASVSFSVAEPQRAFDIFDVFLTVFKEEIGEDLEKIYLIEALLFLSMIPLHSESLEHQYAMLATGIEILSGVADIEA